MPRSKQTEQTTAPGMIIHQRISEAARLFTQQILHILGSSTLAELTALSQAGPTAQAQVAGRGPSLAAQRRERQAQPVTAEKKKVLDFLLSIGRMPVQCPVPGCETRGVRSKNNFCSEHYRTLPKDEQIRLREEQKRLAKEGGGQIPPPRTVAGQNVTAPRIRKKAS
jgi:hypothetical protein